MVYRKLSIVFLLGVWAFFAQAQDKRVMGMVNDKLKKEQPKKVKYMAVKKTKNPIKLTFTGFFLGYKYLISSQDGNRCTMYPTCSEYGLMSVKKHFFLVGMLDTFDRLTRCNGNHDAYEYNEETDTYIDFP